MGQYYYFRDKKNKILYHLEKARPDEYGMKHVMLKLGEEDMGAEKHKGRWYFSDKLLALYQILESSKGNARLAYIGDYFDEYEMIEKRIEEGKYIEKTLKVKQKYNRDLKNAYFINKTDKEILSINSLVKSFPSDKLNFVPLAIMFLKKDSNATSDLEFLRRELKENIPNDLYEMNKELSDKFIENYIKNIYGRFTDKEVEVISNVPLHEVREKYGKEYNLINSDIDFYLQLNNFINELNEKMRLEEQKIEQENKFNYGF